MIELLASLTVLNVGILAIVAAFNSGAITLRRASQISTAAALADQQMERFRAITYGAISLDTTSVAAAAAPYGSDTAYNASQVTATCSPLVNECTPVRTISAAASPDHRAYRVDTYIVFETPTSGRALKKVTVVVRDGATMAALARASSTFDQSTG